jgi:hypothetical protein
MRRKKTLFWLLLIWLLLRNGLKIIFLSFWLLNNKKAPTAGAFYKHKKGI